MNIQSILLLLAIGLGFLAALRAGKKKSHCGCCGNCKSCGNKCCK